MLYLAFLCFVVSVVSAILGFSDIAAASAGVGELLFYVFLGLFFLTMLIHFVRGVDEKVNTNLNIL